MSCPSSRAGLHYNIRLSFHAAISSTPSFLSLPHTQGIELGHVDIISTNELFVPAYNSPVRFISQSQYLCFLYVLFTRPSRLACVAPYCLPFLLLSSCT